MLLVMRFVDNSSLEVILHVEFALVLYLLIVLSIRIVLIVSYSDGKILFYLMNYLDNIFYFILSKNLMLI